MWRDQCSDWGQDGFQNGPKRLRHRSQDDELNDCGQDGFQIQLNGLKHWTQYDELNGMIVDKMVPTWDSRG